MVLSIYLYRPIVHSVPPPQSRRHSQSRHHLWHPTQMLMTRLSFCSRLSSRSPCLMVAWYCADWWSGRVDETTRFTLSILQLSRSAEMHMEHKVNPERSLLLIT